MLLQRAVCLVNKLLTGLRLKTPQFTCVLSTSELPRFYFKSNQSYQSVISWDKRKLQNIIETAARLGYSTVAINHVVNLQEKKQGLQDVGKPTCVAELFTSPPIVQGKSKPIKIITRLTLVVSEGSHCNELVSKTLQTACMTLDVDIIEIIMTEKQQFNFRRSPVNAAIDRGIVFELVYSPAIKDSTMRRYTISNSLSLMNISKGKNIIISSEAEKPLELRGPYDIANLGLLFGLSEGDAKAAISTNCRKALLHGETRKTAQGVVHSMKTTEAPEDKKEAPASKRKN
ncbi:ribonuclease P protein subunit p30-like [Polyodon spathula]|uniref:ribonuclease P protein subunit p30-like n=1 Tax=Polyodon spathula TaxID=7913 RepID=UPI001B7EC04C|nr:ribonuclease P protein subunit p30-like [Polyodon spathula]